LINLIVLRLVVFLLICPILNEMMFE